MYEGVLVELGFAQRPLEPGIYRKKSKVVIGQYVEVSVCAEDNLIAGPDKGWSI